MKLLNFEKQPNNVYASADDFGALWEQAERHGKLSLGPKLFGSGTYQAEITFNRKAGSTVYARGEHVDKSLAIKAAIAEAIDMGAESKP